MERSKIVAIITGIISLLLAIAYLLIVQLLDFRGEMLPAPVDLGLHNWGLSHWNLHNWAKLMGFTGEMGFY